MKRSILLLVLVLVASYCHAQVDGKELGNKVNVGSGSLQTPPIRKEVFFFSRYGYNTTNFQGYSNPSRGRKNNLPFSVFMFKG